MHNQKEGIQPQWTKYLLHQLLSFQLNLLAIDLQPQPSNDITLRTTISKTLFMSNHWLMTLYTVFGILGEKRKEENSCCLGVSDSRGSYFLSSCLGVEKKRNKMKVAILSINDLD